MGESWRSMGIPKGTKHRFRGFAEIVRAMARHLLLLSPMVKAELLLMA